MTGWVRLWHDMPSDPKWRTIARKSGQRVGDVIAVFNFLMVDASENALERGRTQGFASDDVATALDLEEGDVEAILKAMEGKVIEKGRLMGWEKRQPKREDSGAPRRKKEWKERQWNASERIGTHRNAEKRPDTDTDTEDSVPNGTAGPDIDPEKLLFDRGVAFLTSNGCDEPKARTMLGKWKQAHGSAGTIVALSSAIRAGATEPISYITACLKRRENDEQPTSIESERAKIRDPILRDVFDRLAAQMVSSS